MHDFELGSTSSGGNGGRAWTRIDGVGIAGSCAKDAAAKETSTGVAGKVKGALSMSSSLSALNEPGEDGDEDIAL